MIATALPLRSCHLLLLYHNLLLLWCKRRCMYLNAPQQQTWLRMAAVLAFVVRRQSVSKHSCAQRGIPINKGLMYCRPRLTMSLRCSLCILCALSFCAMCRVKIKSSIRYWLMLVTSVPFLSYSADLLCRRLLLWACMSFLRCT